MTNCNHVWCARYCDCVMEGGMVIIDDKLCKTREQAREIMRQHKAEDFRAGGKPRKFQRWDVVRMEISN